MLGNRLKAMAMALVLGLFPAALLPTPDNHAVTANIPSILVLNLDATNYLLLTSATPPSPERRAVTGGTPYTKASQAAYIDLPRTPRAAFQDFAPTSVTGRAGRTTARDRPHQPRPAGRRRSTPSRRPHPGQRQGEGLRREGERQGGFPGPRSHHHRPQHHPS